MLSGATSLRHKHKTVLPKFQWNLIMILDKTIQGLTLIVNVQRKKTQSFFLRFVLSRLNLFGFISEHYTE